jgi:hypothetical protein
MENNGLVIEPGHGEDNPGVKRGPYSDSSSDFHESAFSAFHTGSEVCGTCHNVSHVSFGTKLETTYDEWKNGPYNSSNEKKRVTCQGCHMYQRPGIPATGSGPRPMNKGVAAEGGPERGHVFTHYFIGANSYIPGLNGDASKAKMAVERLMNSATLSLDTRGLSKGKFSVIVTNSGAGHFLPTGLTDVRQMWLEIRVADERGKTVYTNGTLDKNGDIPDGSIIYNTVFGDGQGNPVSNISKAREILKDKRIRPRESSVEKVTFKPVRSKKLTVTVKLLYRSAPQGLVDAVMGKGKNILPVVTMEKIVKTVTL